MKKIIIALAVATLLLTGCSAPAVEGQDTSSETDSGFTETHTVLKDGRTVVCLWSYKVGLSCDWDNAE